MKRFTCVSISQVAKAWILLKIVLPAIPVTSFRRHSEREVNTSEWHLLHDDRNRNSPINSLRLIPRVISVDPMHWFVLLFHDTNLFQCVQNKCGFTIETSYSLHHNVINHSGFVRGRHWFWTEAKKGRQLYWRPHAREKQYFMTFVSPMMKSQQTHWRMEDIKLDPCNTPK